MLQTFARYEFKYLMFDEDVRRIMADLNAFMAPDNYVKSADETNYFVRSLYFDTKQFRNYYEKIDGIKMRHKYRLRTYSESPNSDIPIFLERKERNNNRVIKIREQLTPIDTDRICLDTWDCFQLDQGNLKQQFGVESLKFRLRPKVVIQYIRTPYVSGHDGKFRVTFDQNLVGIASRHIWDEATRTCRWTSLIPERTVMEVKFNRRIPAWFHRIIQAYGLDRVSISKYVLGVTRLNLARNLS